MIFLFNQISSYIFYFYFYIQKKRIIERNRGIISEINFDYIKQVNECYESCYIKN